MATSGMDTLAFFRFLTVTLMALSSGEGNRRRKNGLKNRFLHNLLGDNGGKGFVCPAHELGDVAGAQERLQVVEAV